jgi:hypothetical protein
MRSRFHVVGLILVLGLGALSLSATEFKPVTAAAFDRYIALTEDHIAADDRDSHFLVLDKMQDESRKKIYADLHKGKLFIEPNRTTDEGRRVPIPDGLTHDWIGVVFIPGGTLAGTLAFLEDADHYQEIFQPAVRRSHLISRQENDMKLSEQFYHKTIVTVAVNVDFDTHCEYVDPKHLVCRAHSMRAAEVEHVGQPDEHELPVGNDHGYLWRINTYWHAEQRDEGVYLQVQTVALTRNVPAAFEWVVGPLVKKIPRDTFATFLATTRKAVIARQENAGADPQSPQPRSGATPTEATNDAPQPRR